MKVAYFPVGFDFRAFVCKCYDLSRPQGMGMLHYMPGPLPEDVLGDILTLGKWSNSGTSKCVLHMDYVLGRAVKMAVYSDPSGQYYIHADGWFDHSDAQLEQLLSCFSLQVVEK